MVAGGREEIEATGTCKIYTEMKREVVGASAFEDGGWFLLFIYWKGPTPSVAPTVFIFPTTAVISVLAKVVPQAPIHFLTRDPAGSQMPLTHSSAD